MRRVSWRDGRLNRNPNIQGVAIVICWTCCISFWVDMNMKSLRNMTGAWFCFACGLHFAPFFMTMISKTINTRFNVVNSLKWDSSTTTQIFRWRWTMINQHQPMLLPKPSTHLDRQRAGQYDHIQARIDTNLPEPGYLELCPEAATSWMRSLSIVCSILFPFLFFVSGCGWSHLHPAWFLRGSAGRFIWTGDFPITSYHPVITMYHQYIG